MRTTLAALLVTCVLGSATAGAFPLSNGGAANQVLGRSDFTTGYDLGDPTFLGAAPASASTMFFPVAAAWDPDGDRLFVSDQVNHRVLVFNLANGLTNGEAAAWVLGQTNFTAGGTDPANPYGGANALNAAAGCTTVPNACGMSYPIGLHYDRLNSRLFVGDSGNNRVLVFDVTGPISNGQPAMGVLGQPDFVQNKRSNLCGGVAGTGIDACGLGYAFGIRFDDVSQRLYVADNSDRRVLVFDLSDGLFNGEPAVAVLGQPNFATLRKNNACGGGISAINVCGFDRVGFIELSGPNLFVADASNSRIMVFNVGNGVTNGEPAIAVLGQPNFTTGTVNTSCGGGGSGDGNANACGLGNSYSMAPTVDAANGRLFVSDPYNHRVLAFNIGNGVGNGEAAVAVYGQDTFTAGGSSAQTYNGAPATARDTLAINGQVVYDADQDRLFAVDTGNHRVLVWGANVGGVPIVGYGSTAGAPAATENPDGSITVNLTDTQGRAYSVTLPPGTLPLLNDEIGLFLWAGNRPGILITADLPAGQTKSVTMPAKSSNLCVRDRSGAAMVDDKCQSGAGNTVKVPNKGQCGNYTVDGDPGDNPSNPNDQSGKHSITLCTSADGNTLTLSKLLHTGLQDWKPLKKPKS